MKTQWRWPLRLSPPPLVLVVDEVPELFLADAGEGAALVKLLRRIRQDNKGELAMVLLGSLW